MQGFFNRNIILLALTLFAFLIAQPVLAMTDIMCSESEQCVVCREDVKCQKCYFKCSNKYGQITSDITFAYRLSEPELRALKCYKGCWGEEVDVDVKTNKSSLNNGKNYHKKR